jgi:K+-sensing histidine kinase KdpD
VRDREEALEQRTRVLQTLEAVAVALATEHDFQKATEAVTQTMTTMTGAELGMYFERQVDEHGTETYRPMFTAGQPADPGSPKVTSQLLKAMLPEGFVRIDDFKKDPQFAGSMDELPKVDGKPVRSFLGAPVRSRVGVLFGGLFMFHSQPNGFPVTADHSVRGLSSRAAVVLENARLYSDAREYQEHLQRANRMKDEFLGMVSHELRTPITTIYGGARLLQSRKASLPEEAVDEMIGSIEEEAERLYRLVADLLAIARADVMEHVELEPIAVEPTVTKAVRTFSHRHPSRRVELHMAARLPSVMGEETYLLQVLGNLISNADKYSPNDTPIDIEAHPDNGGIEVRIMDRGPGVPEEEIEQIFESFYRSQSTASKAGGKGLGLAVCRRLIEAMDGRIWARPRDGGGLEVVFTLPLADSRYEPEPVAAGTV